MRSRLLPTILFLQHNIVFQHAKAFHQSSSTIVCSRRNESSQSHQSRDCPKLIECLDTHHKVIQFHSICTRRFSSDVSHSNQDDSVAEIEDQRMRAYEAFSVLARTKKSWQRLGHLVELAADHTNIDTNNRDGGGKSIADVGTDHGLLAMSFALSGRYERVLGVDVSEQALKNGALSLLESVTQVCKQEQDGGSSEVEGKEERIPISFRVSNGCESIEEGEADTVCIAGMGVNTMIKILSMASDSESTRHLDRIKCQQLLLQPTNSRPSNLLLLYDHLQQSGWKLVDERIEELSKRWYISSCFQRIEKAAEYATTIELPASKLAHMQPDATMYPAFQKYVAHHCQWIESDAKARGEVKEADARWLKEFQHRIIN